MSLSQQTSALQQNTNDNHNVPKNLTNGNNPTTNSSPFMFVVCALGICSCYLYYGMLQEQVFRNNSDRIGATFLLVSQTCSNAIVAYGWKRASQAFHAFGGPPRGMKITIKGDTSSTATTPGNLNHLLLLLTSFCYFAAMTCSNESLSHVSYPTNVLAKSCKLIPTMIMGWFVERRSYHVKEWIGAACITIGIVIFNVSRMQDNHSQKREDNNDDQAADSIYGLALLAMSLLMDGMLGACQGLLKREPTTTNHHYSYYRPPSAIETMLFVNIYACLFLFPLAMYTGQWSRGMSILRKHPWGPTARGMALLNLSAAIGQIFIFLTIHNFSSLACTTITTTRKFLTILVSVVMFGHVFSTLQWCCVGLVFGGLYLGIVSKFVVSSPTTTTTTAGTTRHITELNSKSSKKIN